MKFTNWLALPEFSTDWEDCDEAKFSRDTFTTKTCRLCGGGVVDTDLHEQWHRDLGR